MKLIDLLNCMNEKVVVTITAGNEWEYEVYASCTKLEKIPQDLIGLISNRTVKDIYTINDVIKITVE